MKTNTEHQIETVSEFVRAFGGTAAIAEFLDVGMSAVSNWKRENAIPPGWHYRLAEEAKRRHITFSKKVFGMEVEDRPFVAPAAIRRRGRPRAATASAA